jgi:hypothetical protein
MEDRANQERHFYCKMRSFKLFCQKAEMRCNLFDEKSGTGPQLLPFKYLLQTIFIIIIYCVYV